MSTEQPNTNQMNETAWTSAFAELAQRSHLQRLPSAKHAQLLQTFRQHKTANKPPTLWQRLSAALTYDSVAELLPAGARTTRLTEGRQLVFETERGDIALDIQTSADFAALSGQLFLADNEQPHLVQLLSDDQEIAATLSDELGEFSFVGLPFGSYQLVAVAADYELVVDALTLA